MSFAGVAVAWQTALSAVGWTEDQATRIANQFFTSTSALPNGGSMSLEVKKRWIGRSPAERSQAIRDLALHAKRYVQAPAFEKLYTGWIRDRYDAINHGIRIDRNAPAKQEDMNAMMSAASADMVKSMSELPPDAIAMLLKNDIDTLQKSSRAKDKQMLARYQRIEGLLKTNLPEAKKQYAIAKTMQLTGQTDEGQMQAKLAEGAKSSADLKRMEQQRAWDEHNLKAELRRRLDGFITLANSVDFAAKTEPRAGRQMFSDRNLEGKSREWKILYRLGKEPTMAAVAVAQQWLREL